MPLSWPSLLPDPGSWSSPWRTLSSRGCPGSPSTGCLRALPGRPGQLRMRTATRALLTPRMLMMPSPGMLRPLAGKWVFFFINLAYVKHALKANTSVNCEAVKRKLGFVLDKNSKTFQIICHNCANPNHFQQRLLCPSRIRGPRPR